MSSTGFNSKRRVRRRGARLTAAVLGLAGASAVLAESAAVPAPAEGLDPAEAGFIEELADEIPEDELDALVEDAPDGAARTADEGAAAELDEAASEGGAEADVEAEEQAGAFSRRPTERNPGERARVLVDQAREHLQAGEVYDAARTYRRALDLDPEQHVARQGYARILAASGRQERAREVLRAGIEIAPGDQAMARFYAALAHELGDPGSAIAALEQVREAADRPPGSVEAQLAGVHRSVGQHEQALALYEELLEHEPGNLRWQLGVAVTADAAGRTDRARAAWQAVVDAGPDRDEVAGHARSRLEALETETDAES